MKLTIQTNESLFFKQYLNILKPFLRIGDIEAIVLASICYYDYFIKENPEECKDYPALLSTKHRESLRESEGMSTASLNNIISKLKKREFIIKDADTREFILNRPKIVLPKDSVLEIHFKFE